MVIDKMYNKGIYIKWKIYLEGKEWNNALDLMDQAMHDEENPRTSYLLFLKGITYQLSGELRSSARCYIRSIKKGRQSVSLWMCLGEVLAEMGKNKWSLLCFDEARKANPARFTIRSIESEWNRIFKSGDLDKALLCLDEGLSQLLSMTQDDILKMYVSQVFFMKSITHCDMAQYHFAIRDCIQAIRYEPERPKFWKQLGNLLDGDGKPIWASKCFYKSNNLRST